MRILDGNLAAERGEHVARLQNCGELAHVVERARRPDLMGELAPGLFVALRSRQRLFDRLDDAVLESMRGLRGLALLTGEQQPCRIVRKGVRLVRQEVAVDPLPYRRGRGARKASLVDTIGFIVDEERLEEDEEQPGRQLSSRSAADGAGRSATGGSRPNVGNARRCAARG